MVVKSKKRVLENDTESGKKIKLDQLKKDIRSEVSKRLREEVFSDDSDENFSEDLDDNDGSVLSFSSQDSICENNSGEESGSDDDSDKKNQTTNVPNRKEKKRLRRKMKRAERRERLENKPKKEPKPIPLTSTVVMPAKKVEQQDLSTVLEEIKSRYIKRNELSLEIRPIPKHIAPGMITDICPTALSFYRPTYKGANFGFVAFKNLTDLEKGKKELEGKLIKSRQLKITSCAKIKNKYKGKTLNDFDLTKLVVMNLTRNVNRFDLGQIFRSSVDIRFRTLTDKSCAGSCDIIYKNSEDAIKAFYESHQVLIRGIPIYVNFAPKPINGRAPHEAKKDLTNIKDQLVHDPVATSSEDEDEERMSIEDADFDIKNSIKPKGKPGKRLHNYQKRPKNTGPRIKVKKTNYKKR